MPHSVSSAQSPHLEHPPRILIPVLYTSILLSWVDYIVIPKGDAFGALMQLRHNQTERTECKRQGGLEETCFQMNQVPHRRKDLGESLKSQLPITAT